MNRTKSYIASKRSRVGERAEDFLFVLRHAEAEGYLINESSRSYSESGVY